MAIKESKIWDGKGLPPVGCECEMQNEKGEWVAVDVIAKYDGFSFGWNYDYRMVYFSDKPAEFRPISSESDKKRDAAVAAMRNFATNYNNSTVIHAINQVYDAIAAGKVPGIRLE
ncbi:hypothetical protein AB4432_002350 [Escherichia coli]